MQICQMYAKKTILSYIFQGPERGHPGHMHQGFHHKGGRWGLYQNGLSLTLRAILTFTGLMLMLTLQHIAQPQQDDEEAVKLWCVHGGRCMWLKSYGIPS